MYIVLFKKGKEFIYIVFCILISFEIYSIQTVKYVLDIKNLCILLLEKEKESCWIFINFKIYKILFGY